jgi:hypothetical protein
MLFNAHSRNGALGLFIALLLDDPQFFFKFLSWFSSEFPVISLSIFILLIKHYVLINSWLKSSWAYLVFVSNSADRHSKVMIRSICITPRRWFLTIISSSNCSRCSLSLFCHVVNMKLRLKVHPLNVHILSIMLLMRLVFVFKHSIYEVLEWLCNSDECAFDPITKLEYR